MSVGYVPVQWNRSKRIYDAVLVSAIVLFLAAFIGVGKIVFRGDEAISDPILIIRALGACAYSLLHLILCIGPLARLDRRFLPLLYNRRHLGVMTFMLALLHGTLVLGFYHGFGRINPFLSLLTGNTNYYSLTSFPFQILGAIALCIMFVMAVTSHDFWLKNLTPRTWKRLHMAVYYAYALLVMHVALGALQSQRSPLLAGLLILGVVVVVSLHLVTGRREARRDSQRSTEERVDEWVAVASIDEIPDQRAKVVCLPGRERVAVFRNGNCISAITNVCAHQNGPLGEGRIVDGCVTCPWHGWQYQPHNGQSPPPFAEKVPTFRIRVEGNQVYLNPHPLPPGTAVEPAQSTDTLDSKAMRALQ